ncbi:RILP-like protein 1 [Syngnathoides biaculeatus]|uniref:RILP-like protein 1 n=1 Tax=Syngnathoides biaculeatus TaxID=300417 RepID=UPI002ADE95F2|nr:RILP-like protein 1 [Syngnathoides biaculeatus]
MSALERPCSELTVLDVYDIAAALAREFERTIERFGCEALAGVVPKVVRVLELLETLVGSGGGGQEADELRRELLRLQQERSDRTAQERKHHQELEEVEDVWRTEVDELLSQIAQLQAENKKLLASRALSQVPVADRDPHHQEEGTSQMEKQAMTRLNELLEKQRDEIRAKDHQLTLKNEDIEALQMQQHRLIRINQDLRHRLGRMEAHGAEAVRRRAELEAAARAHRRQTDALRHELRCLRKERQEWELERELAKMEESLPSVSASKGSPQASKCGVKADSVWVECGGDHDHLENISNFLCNSARGDVNRSQQDTDKSVSLLEEEEEEVVATAVEEREEEEESESDTPQFTLQEFRDVLQERNQLKAQVFLLEEELTYYKSEDMDEDVSCLLGTSPPPPSCSASSDQPESGIRRLIFTAIMPMVAAGLIGDDPTLLPIRRLVSFV